MPLPSRRRWSNAERQQLLAICAREQAAGVTSLRHIASAAAEELGRSTPSVQLKLLRLLGRSDQRRQQAVPQRSCGRCVFWNRIDVEEGDGLGECRRYAPQPRQLQLFPLADATPHHRAAWPETGAEDWCGDFVAKPARG